MDCTDISTCIEIEMLGFLLTVVNYPHHWIFFSIWLWLTVIHELFVTTRNFTIVCIFKYLTITLVTGQVQIRKNWSKAIILRYRFQDGYLTCLYNIMERSHSTTITRISRSWTQISCRRCLSKDACKRCAYKWLTADDKIVQKMNMYISSYYNI